MVGQHRRIEGLGVHPRESLLNVEVVGSVDVALRRYRRAIWAHDQCRVVTESERRMHHRCQSQQARAGSDQQRRTHPTATVISHGNLPRLATGWRRELFRRCGDRNAARTVRSVRAVSAGPRNRRTNIVIAGRCIRANSFVVPQPIGHIRLFVCPHRQLAGTGWRRACPFGWARFGGGGVSESGVYQARCPWCVADSAKRSPEDTLAGTQWNRGSDAPRARQRTRQDTCPPQRAAN
jgi:hypothetical protein